jgi:hypothetical protein
MLGVSTLKYEYTPDGKKKKEYETSACVPTHALQILSIKKISCSYIDIGYLYYQCI